MDFNVSGDVNDPAFSASGIILKAFANLITKAATAPFKLLGGVVPGGDEISLDTIEFAAGRAEITSPEREKLAQLTAALTQRPNLELSVPGTYNPAADTAALQAAAVDTQLATLIDNGKNNNAQLMERTRKGLEKLAKQQLEDFSAGALRQKFERPNPQSGAVDFDEVAYIDAVREQLEAAQPISDAELMQLAEARQTAIIGILGDDDQLEPARVQAGAISEADTTNRGTVVLELGIEIGKATAIEAAKPSP